jgi:2-polyprenyl-3-methyl-5-hydroxy-6-metoxy-1,4-benzoquinol methylase/ribosomal protein S27E
MLPNSMKSNLLTVETSCNNCGSNESTVFSRGTDYEQGTTDDIFTFVRCQDCGLVYLNPRPDVSELPILYPADYIAYNIQSIYDERQRKSFYSKVRYARFESMLLKHLKEFFPIKRKLVLLDIGCADGHTLNMFKRIPDFEIETHGIDMNSDSVAVAKAGGHRTYAGRFEDVDLPQSHFDLVYSSHVIEHVPDPKAFAKKVRTLLKPGGILWLWTPNVGSIDAKWFQNKYWGLYCFPRHFFLYDSKSIRRLAYETDFQVVKVDYCAVWFGWVMTLHNLCKGNKHLCQYAEPLFSVNQMTKITPWNFLRNCCFTLADLLLLFATGQTGANMEAVLKKCDSNAKDDAP